LTNRCFGSITVIDPHADSDHIGGLIGVLQATDIPVQSVLYSDYPDPDNSLTWQSFVGAVVSGGLTLTVAQYP
jgi:beta-lactamase superfamily II metal-dependent hydrolase